MSDASIFSVVCVDVLVLCYDTEAREIRLGLHRRSAPPFEGEFALPGVIVKSGERLAHAACRAIDKLGLSPPARALGQLRTFDEPSRDPRGPSLSVAMWAVYPPETLSMPGPVWQSPSSAMGLAFDHDAIVVTGREILASLCWRDLTFTRALTGDRFTATDAVAITAQLTGRSVHRANLNRELARLDGLHEAGLAPAAGGRPPKIWRWDEATHAIA